MNRLPDNKKTPENSKPADNTRSAEPKKDTLESVVDVVSKQQLSLFTPYRTISLIGKILFFILFFWIITSISSVNQSVMDLNRRLYTYEQKLQDKTSGIEVDIAVIKRTMSNFERMQQDGG